MEFLADNHALQISQHLNLNWPCVHSTVTVYCIMAWHEHKHECTITLKMTSTKYRPLHRIEICNACTCAQLIHIAHYILCTLY